jgi:hypothetical protein
LERYEDPAESCPYISSEGGYQYIYGGPCTAEEALRDDWGDVFVEHFLDRVAVRLEEELGTTLWSDVPTDDEDKDD